MSQLAPAYAHPFWTLAFIAAWKFRAVIPIRRKAARSPRA